MKDLFFLPKHAPSHSVAFNTTGHYRRTSASVQIQPGFQNVIKIEAQCPLPAGKEFVTALKTEAMITLKPSLMCEGLSFGTLLSILCHKT